MVLCGHFSGREAEARGEERPCGGAPADLCVKGPVRGGVPAELCVKGLVPEIFAETFFVDIYRWSWRLDPSTGGNLRGRQGLLESARVAQTSPVYVKMFFTFWARDFRFSSGF